MKSDNVVLTCGKGCPGRCCEVGGTALQLLATEEEAKSIGLHIGRAPVMHSGRTIDRLQLGQIIESPCPFYVDRACSIYSVRPEGCRRYQCDLTAPHIKSAESLAQLSEMLTEQVAKGALYADLREWFPLAEARHSLTNNTNSIIESYGLEASKAACF